MARILVIEDEKNIARAVKDKLSHDGHQVEFRQSGPEALAFLKEAIVDLIILDVLMPDMDGFEVVDRLKADGRTRSIPIIILSVLSEDERVQSLGVEGHLTKPYKGADLLRIVHETLALRAGGKHGK